MSQALTGKVAILTGASRGIGHAIAHALASQGVRLMLVSRTQAALEALQKELLAQYDACQDVAVAVASVTDAQAVTKAVEATMAQFGRVDILINNAGIGVKFQLFQEIALDDMDALIDTNVKGPMYFMHQVIPHMVNQGGGDIININSIAGKKSFAYCSVYTATKFALSGLTAAVAQEQLPNNVRVTSICPGRVNTPMWDVLEPETDVETDKMLVPEDVANAVLYMLQQPRNGIVEEMTLMPNYQFS